MQNTMNINMDDVEATIEHRVIPFNNTGRIPIQRKHVGKRAIVIIFKKKKLIDGDNVDDVMER